MNDIIECVEEGFRQKGRGDFEMPPKPGIHPAPDSFIHAMPAFLPKLRAAGIKWISGYPENVNRDLPYISGLLILNDPSTGLPISVMDAAWITAKRTGAATAVAAKYLARKDARVFGILGCGVQGRSNLEALQNSIKTLEEVRAYDISKTRLQLYLDEMTAKSGLLIRPVNSPREAVQGSDIVVTSGPILKTPSPTIERAWVNEGVFACPIDFDSYWKPEAMRSMHKFCTDDTEQLRYYKSAGYFQDIPEVYADLAQIVLGHKPGRESEEERIMSMNLGIAIEDMSVAMRLYEEATRIGIGQWLEL
jgi:ornithine cyclodeaminase/alanine dehydrogenase